MGLCGIQTILKLECCKCARMRFYCASVQVVLRICAPQREHWQRLVSHKKIRRRDVAWREEAFLPLTLRWCSSVNGLITVWLFQIFQFGEPSCLNNNLEKLQNSANREMTKVMDWLTANKLSLNISKTKDMLITNKHISTEFLVINVNRNRIERVLTYKYLGVSGDEKLTWKEHCKQLCCTISKYVDIMYKVEHYVYNQASCMLYHSLINSRAQCGINAWGRAASCHLRLISIVLNRAMRYLNTNNLLNNKVTTIYKTQKIIHPRKKKIDTIFKWANSCTNILTLSYLQRLTIILNSFQIFIHIIQDKSKLDNLLYQKHVQTQVLKW